MGLFVERVAPTDDLETAVVTALRTDSKEADDKGAVARHVHAIKRATRRTVVVYHWAAIIVGIVIGAVLLAVGIGLSIYADNWAADQALRAAKTSGYIAPSSSLPAIATSIIALGSAWSGALVGQVLGGGDS
jgi:hypothetical protein